MAAHLEPATVLSFEEARRVVEEHASRLRPKGRELLGLLDAAGRILAEPIQADREYPPFPRATRDGYAVCARDLENLPAMLVVMVEHTSRVGNCVEVRRSVSVGENIVPVGAEARLGDKLLFPGTRLSYAEIAVAASVGRSRLVVHASPRVAVLSTGDEVVDVDVPPGPNQIRNSNSYSLAAQIQAAGGIPVLLPIAPDESGRLRELLTEGLDADLLLVAGGVSMGKYDLVEQVLTEIGAEFFFTGAQIQPGRPIVFGRVPCGAGAHAREGSSAAENHRYFFGLPGNPISTMVTFELFARPVLDALAGMTAQKLVFVHAKLRREIRTKTGLKRFLPAVLSGEFEQVEVELVRWQGSGDIGAVARANCFVVVPPNRERMEAGEPVPVLLR